MEKYFYTPDEGSMGSTLPPVEDVGGKALGLYWLAWQKFPVPPTWTLATGLYDMALERAGVALVAQRIWKSLLSAQHDWNTAQRALDMFEPDRQRVIESLSTLNWFDRAAMAVSSLPRDVKQWAVRSSATVEDNVRQSFAGQFSSFLSVPNDLHQLWDAIRRVWISTFERQVFLYCIQHKTHMPRMAVVLQPMQPITAADRSGVAFSHSPVPTLPGVLIQVAPGSAETVVAGYGGDLYAIHEGRVTVQELPLPHIQVSAETGGTVKHPPVREGALLTEEQALLMADLMKRISERWGAPVDVEFIWRAGEDLPTIVQIRPAKVPEGN